MTAKKYTKKCDGLSTEKYKRYINILLLLLLLLCTWKLLFATLNLLGFWRSRCRHRRGIDILNSPMRGPAATQAKMCRIYFEKEVKNYGNERSYITQKVAYCLKL